MKNQVTLAISQTNLNQFRVFKAGSTFCQTDTPGKQQAKRENRNHLYFHSTLQVTKQTVNLMPNWYIVLSLYN